MKKLSIHYVVIFVLAIAASNFATSAEARCSVNGAGECAWWGR